MSYPPPLYPGDRGELTATYRLSGQAPEVQRANWDECPLPGDGRLNRRAVRAVPLGDGHRPRRPGPSFPPDNLGVVLHPRGQRGPSSTAPTGSIPSPATGSTCRPAGFTALKNTSGTPAKMLLHFCPGAPREEYFERVPDMRGRDRGGAVRFLPEARHVSGYEPSDRTHQEPPWPCCVCEGTGRCPPRGARSLRGWRAVTSRRSASSVPAVTWVSSLGSIIGEDLFPSPAPAAHRAPTRSSGPVNPGSATIGPSGEFGPGKRIGAGSPLAGRDHHGG